MIWSWIGLHHRLYPTNQGSLDNLILPVKCIWNCNRMSRLRWWIGSYFFSKICILMCNNPYSYPTEFFSKQVNKTCWEDFQVSNNCRSAGYHFHSKESFWLILSILFRFFASVYPFVLSIAVLNYNSRILREKF